jgi:hypothetical protein
LFHVRKSPRKHDGLEFLIWQGSEDDDLFEKCFKKWGVSKLKKNREKRSASFQKKKRLFFEKEAKTGGGCQN